MPGQLSGGEQQNVALARAFASQPGVLLMDEPLSSLDALLRESVRLELRDLQKHLGITMIYIIHDQAEALAMADDLVVMRRAEVAQIVDPRAVYEAPVDSFVANLLGAANLAECYAASVEGGQSQSTMPGLLRLLVGQAGKGLIPGSDALLMSRPEDLILSPDVTGAIWTGQVRQRFYQDNKLVYVVELASGARLQVDAPNDDAVPVEGAVFLGTKPGAAVIAYPAAQAARG